VLVVGEAAGIGVILEVVPAEIVASWNQSLD